MITHELEPLSATAICGRRTEWNKRKREKGRGVAKESDAQAIAMLGELPKLLAALPRSVREQEPREVICALIADLGRKRAFPEAHYVLAGRLLTPALAQMVENLDKHWVGELEGGCPIQWEGPWLQLDRVAEKLRLESPGSFRAVQLRALDGTAKIAALFSRSIRLDHYGRKRIVILHETAELSDSPIFLFTDALFWEGRRIAQLWQYRWEAYMFE